MSWVTTKALLWACGIFLLALLGVSTYAYIQHQVAERRQSDLALVQGKLDVAVSANRASTNQIARLVKERDDLLLKRAVEQEAAEKAVAESREVAVTVYNELVAAKRQINAMSLHQGCKPVLTAQVCPEIADALRVP